MNFVWRLLNNAAPAVTNLPSDFATKNNLTEAGAVIPDAAPSGTRYDVRFVGSAGQLNAQSQSVRMSGMVATLFAPSMVAGQAKQLTFTALTGRAADVDPAVKVTAVSPNGAADGHAKYVLTIKNTAGAAVDGPFYIEVTLPPALSTYKVFNSAGLTVGGKHYLVVSRLTAPSRWTPMDSFAGNSTTTLELDLLLPPGTTRASTALPTFRILSGGLP